MAVVSSMKSMKTTAMKATAMKAVTKSLSAQKTTISLDAHEPQTPRENRHSDGSCCVSPNSTISTSSCAPVKKTCTILAVAAALYAAGSTLERTALVHHSSLLTSVPIGGFANRDASLPNTTKLSACAAAAGAAAAGRSAQPVDVLTEQHAQLGFDVSALLESIAKPLERELGALEVDLHDYGASNSSADHFVGRALVTARNAVSYVFAPFVAACKRSTAQRALAAKFSALLEQRPPSGGSALAGVRQAAGDVSNLFAACSQPGAQVAKKNNRPSSISAAIAKKFPASHVANPAPAKFVYNTVVSDGWAMEMRTVSGLWTNVVVGRGDFVLALSRNANGAVAFSVNGMALGSV